MEYLQAVVGLGKKLIEMSMLMNDNARMFDGYGITIPLSAYHDFDGERRRENVWWVVGGVLPATNRSTHRSFLAFRSLSQTQSWRETLIFHN